MIDKKNNNTILIYQVSIDRESYRDEHRSHEKQYYSNMIAKAFTTIYIGTAIAYIVFNRKNVSTVNVLKHIRLALIAISQR